MSGAKPEPIGWGNDPVSDFIKVAHKNGYATFEQYKPVFDILIGTDKLFRSVRDLLDNNNEEKVLSGLMLLRSHSSFLGAVRLAISCQATESYMVQRGCLESALYGFKFDIDKESSEVWLRRDESKETLRKTKSCFRIQPILTALKDKAPVLGGHVANFYNETIKFGAHPNPTALLSTLNITETEAPGNRVSTNYQSEYLTGNHLVLWTCLKTNAEIGLCSLEIFDKCFSKRFEIMGISEHINSLKLQFGRVIKQEKLKYEANARGAI